MSQLTSVTVLPLKMPSPVEIQDSKAKEFQNAGLVDRINLYRENKECRPLYVSLLQPKVVDLFAYHSSLCIFFWEIHEAFERTCCPDKSSTNQRCIGSASQAEVFSHASLIQKYYLIRELRDSPQVVKLIMYLPEEIYQAELFCRMFKDWERRDLHFFNREGTKKLAQVCAKVQEEQNWYLDGITCVATADFPETRLCGVCEEEFTAGISGIRALCSSHASHNQCFKAGAECLLCKENNYRI